jgi:hypothetical protein
VLFDEALPARLLERAQLDTLIGGRMEWDLMQGRVGLTKHLVQADVWAGDQEGRDQVLTQLFEAIEALPGEGFSKSFITGRRSGGTGVVGPEAGGSSQLFRASVDFEAWFTET